MKEEWQMAILDVDGPTADAYKSPINGELENSSPSSCHRTTMGHSGL